MRLDKVLTLAGYGSKRTIRRLINSQQVRLDGQVIFDESLNLDPRVQVLTVGQERVTLKPQDQEVYYLLNKPQGVVTAVSDAKNRTVLDLLDLTDRREGLYPVGRLDADTRGLLLITNNGRLGYRLLHPKFHVPKTYAVEVNGPLDQRAVQAFNRGVVFLDGTVCKPAHLTILSTSPSQSKALLTLQEGKFHQVKKMFLSVGVKVTALKRTRFGPLQLTDDLSEGAYRPLSDEEVLSLLPHFN